MPQIPRYERQVSQATLSLPSIPESAGGIVPSAIEKIGAVVTDFGLDQQKQIDELNRIREAGKFQAEASRQMEALRDSYLSDPTFNTDPESFRGRFQKDAKVITEGLLPQIKDPFVRERMGAYIDTHAIEHDAQFTSTIRAKSYDLLAADAVNSSNLFLELAKTAGSPEMAENYLAQNADLIDNLQRTGVIKAEEAAKAKLASRSKVAESRVLQMIQRDPYAAEETLNSGGDLAKWIPEDRKLELYKHISSEQNRLEAQQERAYNKALAEQNRRARLLASKADDWLASISDTGTGGYDLPGELRAIGTEDALRAADDLDSKRKIYETAFRVTNANADKPFDQQFKAVEEAFTYQPGEQSAKEKIAARDAALRSVQRRLDAFTKDPAAYAESSLSKVAGETPEDHADRSLQLQRDLSEKIPGIEPSILTKDQAKNFQKGWEKMGAEAKFATIASAQKEYGKHAQRFLNEAGVNPSSIYAVEAALEPKSLKAAQALVQADGLKEADIPGDEKTKKDIKKAVIDALDGSDAWKALTAVSRLQPFNQSAMTYTMNLQSSLVKAAMMTGDVDSVIDMLARTHKVISDDSLAQIVVPKGIGLETYELENLLRGERNGVESVIGWQNAKPGDPMASTLFKEKVRDLQKHGVWVNSPGGEGFNLVDPTTGKAVTTEGGKPWTVSINDLLIKKREKPEAADLGVSVPAGMGASLEKGIIGGYDITRYATEKTHEETVARVYGKVRETGDLSAYIASVAPNSPVTADMVQKAAARFGVDPHLMVAIMQTDSNMGTAGKGARTNNPGNVGNDDSGKLRYFASWQDGVDAVAKWLSRHRVKSGVA